MIERNKRSELTKILYVKAAAIRKMEWNKKEVRRLESLRLTELDKVNRITLEIEIRRGEGIIDTQRIDLLKLSIVKMAEKAGIDYNQMRYQETLFNKGRPTC